ncbi:hypothetical protein [Parasphingorhabdus sp.]|uniref:hypothetical protein n=1 Tax=Parasphingorhabdus sp. TaxID=2709688 RepID=UPI0032EF7996
MTDIVVDTNVLVHSCNPKDKWFCDSVLFIERLRKSTLIILVDGGLDVEEAKNTSRIWSEYLEHVPKSSLAAELLAELMTAGRILDVEVQVQPHLRKLIDQKITDKSDRVFLKAAINSQSKTLTSHDDAAFPKAVRKEFGKKKIATINYCSEAAL